MAQGHGAFPSLLAMLRSLAPLPDEEAHALRAAIRELELPSGGPMDPETIGFVIEGLVRAYDLDADGKARTQAFWEPGMLVYSLGATEARPGQPSATTAAPAIEDWTVEAVEPARLFTLSLRALDDLYRGHPCWNHIGRVFWQHAYREKLVRERFLLRSATERYLEFGRRFAAVERRIPQYLVASYLAITPVALSRLRGRPRRRPAPD